MASAHTTVIRARNFFEISMRVLLEMRPTYQRLCPVAIAFFLVPGCGDKHLDKPLPKTSERIKVELPWRDGGTIPRRYTCDGAQTKPAVRVSGTGGAPAASAIVMTDPDAPGGTLWHGPRGARGPARNISAKTGTGAPSPPKGDRPHRYV